MGEKVIFCKEKNNDDTLGTVEQEFFKKLENSPLIPQEETARLIKKYHEGNSRAKEEVFYGNLRLVASIGKRYISRVIHMKFADILQEGMISLWDSIETYNLEESAFSTYATLLITRQIDRAIEKEENMVRCPRNALSEDKKDELLTSAEKRVTDKKIGERKQTSTLGHLRKKATNRWVSINKKLDNDENGATLEDFIADEKTPNSYENVINKETDKLLLSFLNYTLPPYDFLILYYRILIPKPITLEKISDELGMTREGIRQKEKNLKERLKFYFKDNQKMYMKLLKRMNVSKLERIKKTPLTPRDITKYFYLSPFLNNIEYEIYYDLYIAKETFSNEEISQKLKITCEELQTLLANMNAKINNIDMTDYETYHEDLRNLYKTSLYTIASKKGERPLDYNYLKKKYDFTLEDFLSLYQSEWEELSIKERSLLEKYFKGIPNGPMHQTYTIMFLNVLLYGYRKKDTHLPISKLKEAYLKKKHEFSEDQQLAIEKIILGNMARKKFNRLYGVCIDAEDITYIIFRLEKMYYNIDKYTHNSFDKEKYLEVKKKYPTKVTGETEKLLDLYYGVNGENYSIEEIAEILDTSYKLVSSEIRSAYKSIINLYANRSCALNIDKTIYIPYIIDPKYQFAQNIKKILVLFFLEDKTYEEIETITDLSSSDISNKITAAIRRIDFIRYHITDTFYPEQEILEEIIKKPSSFSDFEKKIIQEKYVDNLDDDKIAKQNSISKKKVSDIIIRFNKIYRKYLIKDVVLEKSDIENELLKQRTECILTEIEKQFVSYLYGIKNQYNKEGVKLNKTEITKRLNLPNSHTYGNMKTSILRKMKHNKIGTYTDTICYIKRKDLNEYLKDVHLPISRKEREIICYLFELNNYPYKSMEEIATLYGEREQSIYNRYARAILAILKYRNKEILGTINYEYDILPNLRYFSKSDRIFIEDYYQNKLTLEDIAKKHQLSYNVVSYRINKISIKIFEIIENKDTKLFDFDYLEAHWQDWTFPFDGDKALAKEVFDFYVGNSCIENLDISDIISILNLDTKPSEVSNMISRFMLASKKHQDKIYKEKIFTFEEIVKYYERAKQDMAEYKKKIYERHIKETIKCKNRRITRIPMEILYDLIKDKYNGGTNIFTLNREAAQKLLIQYRHQIVPTVKTTIMSYYHISYRDLLSGKELSNVYKILDKINKKAKEKKEQQSLSFVPEKPIEK